MNAHFTDRPRSIASGVDTVKGSMVTVQVAVFSPSTVVTVIVAVPTPAPVTVPLDETIATDVLLEDHETLFSAAFVGKTVAVNCSETPMMSDSEDLLSATDSGWTRSP